ncbi:MAG: SH3 domain-containing protein [Firmicutes bacterium]|nr:SH3 domain-containing protein [Bacillota bacterium]
MEQSVVTTILSLIVYLSTALFGGGGTTHNPSLPPANRIESSQEKAASPSTAVISADVVSMRSEPETKSDVTRQLTRGTAVKIKQEKDGWYEVTDQNGTSGWIVKWAAKPTRLISPSTFNQYEIIGYYAESYRGDPRALQSFAGNTDKITTLAPFFYRLDKEGNLSGQTNSELIRMASASGTKVLAVVTNISSSNFSKDTIHALLRSKTARSKAISEILNLLKSKGYSGVNIDFEGVPVADRPYLTAFFRELSNSLRANNYLVTAALPAKTAEEEWSAWSGAYDYQAIAPYLDLAIIMSYDQHYANGPPGPVAAQTWVERVISYSLRHFSPQKLIMGIAAYGYDWNQNSGRALNYAAIQSLINQYKIAPKWHEEYKTPYFSYTKSGVKHEVWYENRQSTAAKLELIDKYNLRGVAIWRLGYEDPGIWNVF